MDRATALILALAVGALIAFQPPANAALGNHVGDLGAAFVSVVISALIVAVLLLAFGHPGRLSGLSALRWAASPAAPWSSCRSSPSDRSGPVA
jgi:uncharacterized membrane protein YdcZ (DUF606 family)